jgi:hypothetical protein
MLLNTAHAECSSAEHRGFSHSLLRRTPSFFDFPARPQNFCSYLTRSQESQGCFIAHFCIGETMNSSNLGRRRIFGGYGVVLT